MVSFKVMDMFSCRSVGAITKCVKALDRDATVRVDMSRHWVEIHSGWAEEKLLSEAIGRAGFTPQPVDPVRPRIAFVGQVDLYLPLE
jgi:copper chaperone